MIKYKRVGGSKRVAFLFHGLFSTPGFFLPYLRRLAEEYTLYLFYVDFRALINEQNFSKLSSDFFGFNLPNPDLAICHSLGAVVPLSLNMNSGETHFVAPPFFCEFDFERFLHHIDRISDEDRWLLESSIKFAKTLEVDILDTAEKIYIPKKDDFFKYRIPRPRKYELFSGNHFDLSEYFNLLV